MPYTTIDKITGQISEATLIQLTDDDSLETVNLEHVSDAIASADAVIDGYCSGRYIVPFSPVPPIIAKCSLDMAIYNLYARRVEVMPEVRDKNNSNAIKLLEMISKGSVSLGASATPPAVEPSRSAAASSQTRQFTRDTLRGL